MLPPPSTQAHWVFGSTGVAFTGNSATGTGQASDDSLVHSTAKLTGDDGETEVEPDADTDGEARGAKPGARRRYSPPRETRASRGVPRAAGPPNRPAGLPVAGTRDQLVDVAFDGRRIGPSGRCATVSKATTARPHLAEPLRPFSTA